MNLQDHLSAEQWSLIEAGETAITQYNRYASPENWFVIGEALLALQNAILKASGSNTARGHKYNKAYAAFKDRLPNLLAIDGAARSNAIWLVNNRAEVEKQLATLPQNLRQKHNHPTTIKRYIDRLNQHKPDLSPPRESPYKKLQEEVVRLQQENDELRKGRQTATPIPATPPLARDAMSHTMQQRYNAALRVAKKTMADEIWAEKRAEWSTQFETYIVHWRERVALAEKIRENFRGIILRKDYRIILSLLHPDRFVNDPEETKQRAREAFELFKKLEKRLVKPDPPTFSGPPLPATVAEPMAGRRKPRS